MTPKLIMQYAAGKDGKVSSTVIKDLLTRESALNKAFFYIQQSLTSRQNSPKETKNMGGHGKYINIYNFNKALFNAEKETDPRLVHYQYIKPINYESKNGAPIAIPSVVTVLNCDGIDKVCGAVPIRVSVRHNKQGKRVNSASQDFGAAITIAKRQSLSLVFGINSKSQEQNNYYGNNNYGGRYNYRRNYSYQRNNNNYNGRSRYYQGQQNYPQNNQNNYPQNNQNNYPRNNQTNYQNRYNQTNNTNNTNTSSRNFNSASPSGNTNTQTSGSQTKVNTTQYLNHDQIKHVELVMLKACKLNNMPKDKMSASVKRMAGMNSTDKLATQFPAKQYSHIMKYLNSMIAPKEKLKASKTSSK